MENKIEVTELEKIKVNVDELNDISEKLVYVGYTLFKKTNKVARSSGFRAVLLAIALVGYAYFNERDKKQIIDICNKKCKESIKNGTPDDILK